MKRISRGLGTVILTVACAAAVFASVCSAAGDKESPLSVTLLEPQPVRLEAAGMKKLGLVRELVAKKAEMMESWGKRNPTPEDFAEMQKLDQSIAAVRDTKQGITLRLKLTNTAKDPLVVRYGQDTSTNVLSVKGPGAVDLPFDGMMTMDYRMAEPVTIAPGGFKEFTITELKYGARDMSRWLITEAGEYKIRLTFRAALDEEKMTEVTSNQVVLKVTAAGQ